jgi:glycosyltransferase involved in cell wall biosynthesis
MLFEFLKYISPGWYYNIMPLNGYKYFYNYEKLPTNLKELLDIDDKYSNNDAIKLDAAYQCWYKGIIFQNDDISIDINSLKISVNDYYRFVKRFYNSYWVYYILILRIITFHNPILELIAILKVFFVKRINVYESVNVSNKVLIENFDSPIIKEAPKVSVIIPTLNRYKYLKDVLEDLEKQTFKNFEVIIVDQSEPFVNEFYSQFNLEKIVLQQNEKALWLARNTAIKMAKGEFLLFFDDDSRVPENWIIDHLKTLDFFNCDISSGVSLSAVGSKIPKSYSFFRWGDQIDTGNALIKKEVFRKIGLFDRQFEKMRSGDGEFGMRCYLNGFLNVSNPLSYRIHLKVSEGGLRQIGHWDAFRPKKILADRPIPSILYLLRKYFGKSSAIYAILLNVPPSYIPYKYKSKSWSVYLGWSITFIFFPIVIIPIIKSWRKSSEMLSEGPKIEKIL